MGRVTAALVAGILVLTSCSSADSGTEVADASATRSTSAPPVSQDILDFMPGFGDPGGCGHAHNDYLHDRPLIGALESGFCSVEVDIWDEPSGLLVAHDLLDVDPERTLQSLYLDPLRTWVAERGEAYNSGPLILLVDIKSDASSTYAALHEVLKQYSDILTVFEDGAVEVGAVTVVVSGARDRAAMETQSPRYAALDGRLGDVGNEVPIDLMPLISANWQSEFGWVGIGELRDEERTKLESLVAAVHAEGRLLRFWNIPDEAVGWREMLDAGVDLVNTDAIKDLASLLAQR